MNFSIRRHFSTSLRVLALVLALTTIGTWVATGAHRGWTQTSVVEQHHDEVTGIDYPVRREAFVAGIEVLGAGIAAALALAAAGQLIARWPTSRGTTKAPASLTVSA